MNYCENIQKSLDFIEQHLKDDIDINTVVRQSGYSTTHFYRIFQALIGETVKDYIRKRRLSEAAIDILISDNRIIDIAFEYCFNSQEVFTRAFAQIFGITPGRYRERTKQVVLYEKVNTCKKAQLNLQQAPFIDQIIVLNREFSVVGIKETVQPGSSVIQSLWTEFALRKAEIEYALNPCKLLGLCEYMPELTDESQFCYVAGIEVSSLNNIPRGMFSKNIPRSKYAVFTHKGPLSRLKTAYDYIYGAWLPYSGYEVAELDTIEAYDIASGSHDLNFQIYIPIK